MKRYKIKVFCKEDVFYIKRKLWSEPIGNHSPIFCRYKNKTYLVHSEKGDLSDPFRRDDSYLSCLYIKIGDES